MNEHGIELELDVCAEGDGYRIEARSGVGGECSAHIRFDGAELRLEQQLQRLRIALLSSAVTTRRMPSRDETAVQQLGGMLFGQLFSGDVRVLYDTTRQQAAQQLRHLRLVLRIRPPELAAMPWEF